MTLRLAPLDLLPCVLALAFTCACSDSEPDRPAPSAFALELVATANGDEVGCADALSGLGRDGTYSIGLADLRFYVSNLKFWDAKDEELELMLDENDFQYTSDAGSVALIDLTSNDDGSCDAGAIAFGEGTARTNAVITGMAVVESVKAVSLDIGVPQALMQEVIADHSAEGAPSPLNEMQWTWATGYRHFVMNFSVENDAGDAGEGYVHVGSRDCGPEDGLALEDRDECSFVNTPRVLLEDFDLEANRIAVDVPAILAEIDFLSPIYDLDTFEVIGEGPGVECHSSPMQPDCANVFQSFGLDAETGSADPTNDVVFGIE